MNEQESQLAMYQELGQLFYAIAASDNVVRKNESKVLKELIQKEWLAVDDYVDEFGADAAYQIEIVFDWFEYEHMNADDCFDTFSEFYKDNISIFSDRKKKLIWKTSNAIANAFSGKNKSELIMLAKLQLLFAK